MRHIKSLKKSSTGNSIKISSSSSSISSLPDAKKTTTAAKNGRNGEVCNLEFYFRRTYPWQSVYLPTNVDRAFEEVLIMHNISFLTFILLFVSYSLLAIVSGYSRIYTYLVQVRDISLVKYISFKIFRF